MAGGLLGAALRAFRDRVDKTPRQWAPQRSHLGRCGRVAERVGEGSGEFRYPGGGAVRIDAEVGGDLRPWAVVAATIERVRKEVLELTAAFPAPSA